MRVSDDRVGTGAEEEPMTIVYRAARTKLNLPALSELHTARLMWIRGWYRVDLCSRCRMVYPCPTRQLLDMVDEMGKILWSGPHSSICKNDDPRWSGKCLCCMALAKYRRAKGIPR